jgi:Tfp pilus assembly protein PilF
MGGAVMGRRCWLLLALAALQPGCLSMDALTRSSPKTEPGLLPAVESARACKAVAESLAAQGHHEQAIEQLLKARSYDPASDVSPSLARLYARLGKDQPAREEFDLAVAAHPNDADLYNDLGYYQYQRGNWSEAEANLRKAVAVSPKHARAWNNLGMTLAQQGMYPESLDAFEKAVKPGEARCNLAFILLAQGKREQARELYNEALKLDSGLTLARQALAKLDEPRRNASPQ